MEHLKRLVLISLLLVALPGVAQEDESAAYFSLASDKTFTPADTPVVRLWGHGFDKLQFRLYRVNDPVAFFQKLEDDHQFGMQPPPRDPKQRTVLEKFRDWKLSTRLRLKNLVRNQFTMDSRREYVTARIEREGNALRDAGPAKVESYAEVPVLNQQQLVATWEQPFSTTNRWESAAVPIPSKGKGLYLVEATNGRLQAYTIVSVSEFGVISKAAPGRLVVRVVNRTTSAPVAGVSVMAFGKDRKNAPKPIATDAQGVAEVPFTETNPESVLVLARNNTDFAPLTIYGGAISRRDDDIYKGYIYTDRPVYRPGHPVNYRIVFRAQEVNGYRVPAGKEVTVDVQDTDGQSVYKAKHTLSAMGTASGQFTLPASAKLGYHSVEVHLGTAMQSGGFEVQEYRKPEYDVRVTPKDARVIQGASVQAVIDARYFYGEPVANANVTWVVHKQRYWAFFFGDDEEDRYESDGESRYAQREQISEETGKLDAEGKLTVTVPTAKDESDQIYRIEARVTDAAGREITGAGRVIATIGAYSLDIRTDRYVYAPGDNAKFNVTARDYDGKGVPGVQVQVALQTWDWRGRNATDLQKGSGITDASGRAEVTLPVSSGSLRAIATSRTPEGRDVEDTQYVWVTGGADMWGGDEERLRIVPDRSSYKPGDTAKILVLAPKGANLWITVEGQAVHRSQFVRNTGSSVTVDVPIQKEFVPNFWVSATTIHQNTLLRGDKSVKVPPVEQQLSVELKPAKKEYKPGEAGSYVLEAKDFAGKPVSGEFSVGVVDEALYAVKQDSTPDIVNHFYGRQYNRVNTDTSLSYHFNGEAGKRRMQLARVRPFARAQLKPDRMVQPKVRKAFPDTAFWSAAVMTDAAGRATVRLDYPDALTTWRATARGITADTRVGSTVDRVIVRKNLLIRLSSPRFFRQGDLMTVTAIAQNFLANEKKVRVSLEAKGLEIVEGATQELTVPSRGTGTVDFRVRVPAGSREAVLLGKALTDEESDALELTIPVTPYGVKMTEMRGGSLAGGSTQTDAELTIPADAEAGSGSVEISASASPAGAIFEALEYLTSFPYGCTEQTMSSFLPNVIVSQAVKSLNLKTSIDQKQLAVKVRAGMDRLYDFQHEDGGWGWWKSDESHPFMTAYVAAGLQQARAAGYQVEDARIANAVRWLGEQKELDRQPAEQQAFGAYAMALAGKPEAKRTEALYAAKAQLTPYALVLLGLALEAAGDKRAGEVAGMLELKASSNDAEAWWESKRDALLDIDAEATPETTAYAMKLLSHVRPQSSLLPKAAVYLVNHRSQGYYWNSTKQTALVVHGLTDYLKQSGELKPNYTLTAFVNDQPVLTRKFTEADAATPSLVRVPLSGKGRVRVVRSGEGRAYWRATAQYYSQKPASQAKGLSVGREYFRLASTQEGGKVVYALNPLNGPVAQGDVLAVKLTVRSGSSKYLMIEDPIPAGTETVSRDDLYELRPKPDWWTQIFTERELRDDRAVFFQRFSYDRERTYFYLLKVINPGQFRVSPTRVEPMYEPQQFAASEALNLEVRR